MWRIFCWEQSSQLEVISLLKVPKSTANWLFEPKKMCCSSWKHCVYFLFFFCVFRKNMDMITILLSFLFLPFLILHTGCSGKIGLFKEFSLFLATSPSPELGCYWRFGNQPANRTDCTLVLCTASDMCRRVQWIVKKHLVVTWHSNQIIKQ